MDVTNYLALCVGCILLGAVLSGPLWGHYFLEQDRQRRRWNAQRKEREQRMGGLYR